MRNSTFVAAAFAAGMAASASATITGNAVFGDSYIVNGGGRTYSVLDVYIKSNNANDVVSSVYGIAAHKAEWVQQQSRDFIQANNSSWNPNNTSGAAWDSFVTAGMRTQQASEYGATPIALTADPGFSNFNTAGAKRIIGPSTGNGPGWYPAAGANPATNPYARVGFYNGQSGAINTAKNHLAARGRSPIDYDLDGPDGEGNPELQARMKDTATPEALALTDEIRSIVNAAIDQLPDDLRRAIVLRELEGKSYEEIAAEMNCPVGTVRSRIFRAREAIDTRLREVFEGGLGRGEVIG